MYVFSREWAYSLESIESERFAMIEEVFFLLRSGADSAAKGAKSGLPTPKTKNRADASTVPSSRPPRGITIVVPPRCQRGTSAVPARYQCGTSAVPPRYHRGTTKEPNRCRTEQRSRNHCRTQKNDTKSMQNAAKRTQNKAALSKMAPNRNRTEQKGPKSRQNGAELAQIKASRVSYRGTP